MITAAGDNGVISFDGAWIIIQRTRSLGTFVNQGVQGDRYILARTVTAIEFLAPGRGKGFIAFDFPGKNPPRGGIFDAMADENAVVFSAKSEREFRAVFDAIRQALRSVGPAQPVAPSAPMSAPLAVAPARPVPAAPERSPAAWLERNWAEGRVGWERFEQAASANGWNVRRGIGLIQLRHLESGHAVEAFSVNEAVGKMLEFYSSRLGH